MPSFRISVWRSLKECSAVNVFNRDVGLGLPVVLNLWFWLTPIVWMPEMIPEEYRWVLELNPLSYVVRGYRESLITGIPFWYDLGAAVRCWAVIIPTLLLGGYIFRRLKPEFAEVL